MKTIKTYKKLLEKKGVNADGAAILQLSEMSTELEKLIQWMKKNKIPSNVIKPTKEAHKQINIAFENMDGKQ